MQYFYGLFYKRKGYPVDQKLDVIEKNRGHFCIQIPKLSKKKQVPDLSQQTLCSPVFYVPSSSVVSFLLSLTDDRSSFNTFPFDMWHVLCPIDLQLFIITFMQITSLHGDKYFHSPSRKLNNIEL